jgi:hypothetical protein
MQDNAFKSDDLGLTKLTGKVYFNCTCLYSWEEKTGLVRNHNSQCKIHRLYELGEQKCSCKYEISSNELIRVHNEACVVHNANATKQICACKMGEGKFGLKPGVCGNICMKCGLPIK